VSAVAWTPRTLTAKRRHLRVTGTLGVLRTGAEQGVVNVPEVLDKLRATSFYTEEALIDLIFGQWLRR
jgi:predicted nucleic acid-binding protein